MRAPLPFVLESPIKICASRVDNWFGSPRRRAFCVAARAVGEGGRGAGFIACATVRGIVGILHEDTTGSIHYHLKLIGGSSGGGKTNKNTHSNNLDQ